MNKGVLKSKGEWIYFLGSGDVLANSNVLLDISHQLNTHFDLLFGDIAYGLTQQEVFKSSFSAVLWYKNSLHHQSVF
jgi:hypothetical protein